MTYGHTEKLARAVEHMEAIEMITSEWVKTKRVTHDLDAETGERIVRLFLPEAPTELSYRVSECLHNARSALDNLAFALALAYSQGAFTPQRQETSEFPIFWGRAPRRNELERKLGCVDPNARRIIENLQPYCSADHFWLYLLHHLNRVDKHRFGYGAALSQTGLGVGNPAFGDRTVIETMTLTGRVIGMPHGYTELGRYRGWHEIAGQRHMYVPMVVEVDAVFLEPESKGRPIAATIRQIIEKIESEIVKPLRPFL